MKLRGNKIPRFFVQYSHWERRKLRCFFFSALGFGISSFLAWKKANRRIASIGSGYPLPYFRPPALRRIGRKLLAGKCPKPSNSRKEREYMDGRKRTVQLKFRVTETERDLILEKMKLIPTRNMAAYLRKIAINGYIIQIDHSDIKAMTAEIQKIGVNVNQIARRVNSTGSVYQEDIDEIKGVLNEIWRLQRLSLLKAR